MGPAEIDITGAHPARTWDYYLGGKNNFAADRAAADQVIAAWPGMRVSARENRKFIGRAVRYLAGEAGIDQFLDVKTYRRTRQETCDPPGLLLHGGPRPGHARYRRQAGRDGAAELARLAGMSRGLAVENGWLPDLERGYDGIVVGAYARHDALRLQGQSPVQDVVEASSPGRGRLVDGNFRETCPGEQLP
jgi:hypothetical protein